VRSAWSPCGCAGVRDPVLDLTPKLSVLALRVTPLAVVWPNKAEGYPVPLRDLVLSLTVAPLLVVCPGSIYRPVKNYTRGRLRMNLKPTPKAAALPGVAEILEGR